MSTRSRRRMNFWRKTKLMEKQEVIVRTLRVMDDEMGRLWEELDEIEYRYNRRKLRDKICYNCGEKGHIKPNCINMGME